MAVEESGQDADYVISQLFRTLEAIEDRLDKIEAGGRASQLSNSSIDVDKGQGYLPILKDGVERARIGRMPDGTITTVSVNNLDPPGIPNNIFVEPIMAGLAISIETLDGNVPYDFGYIRIYIDGLPNGTITRLPGIWIAAPLDPNTVHRVEAVAVNQSGKESPKSQAIFVKPLNVVEGLGPGSITETEIDDDSISTPKLQALAITAAKMAANSIEAGSIVAGAVTAAKLAAEIILANQRIICGSPLAKRVDITSAGIEQYSELNRLLIQISGGSGGGNIFTVPDPNDPYSTLATLDSQGGLAVSDLSVFNDPTILGDKLSEILDRFPRGLVAQGRIPEMNVYGGFGSNLRGIYELRFRGEAGRSYRIKMIGPSIYIGILAYASIRYTNNGSRPTLTNTFHLANGGGSSSQYNPFYNRVTGVTSGHNHESYYQLPSKDVEVEATLNPTIDIDFGILFCVRNEFSSGFVHLQEPGIFTVEDLGLQVSTTGGRVDGTEASDPVPQRYTWEYYPINGITLPTNGLDTPIPVYDLNQAVDIIYNPIEIGGAQNRVGILNFNVNMRTDYAGGNVEKVELYLYAQQWLNSDGGYPFVCIGAKGVTNDGRDYFYPPNPDIYYEFSDRKMQRPEGKWFTINPSHLVNSSLGSEIPCITLEYGARKGLPGGAAAFSGTFEPVRLPGGAINPKAPRLRVTYTK